MRVKPPAIPNVTHNPQHSAQQTTSTRQLTVANISQSVYDDSNAAAKTRFRPHGVCNPLTYATKVPASVARPTPTRSDPGRSQGTPPEPVPSQRLRWRRPTRRSREGGEKSPLPLGVYSTGVRGLREPPVRFGPPQVHGRRWDASGTGERHRNRWPEGNGSPRRPAHLKWPLKGRSFSVNPGRLLYSIGGSAGNLGLGRSPDTSQDPTPGADMLRVFVAPPVSRFTKVPLEQGENLERSLAPAFAGETWSRGA